MKKWIVLSFISLISIFNTSHAETKSKEYVAKDFSYLKGMKGFSDALLSMHFTLYQGYVKNTNLILNELEKMNQSGDVRSYDYGAIKRRLAFEFDGMRLHELYFSNLGGKGDTTKGKKIIDLITSQYGSYEAWKKDFIATGLMRGIGWTILYIDQESGRLINTWIDEHDTGLLAKSSILLVMDVWEHAFITEYGLNREKYIMAFFDNISWGVVEKRLSL